MRDPDPYLHDYYLDPVKALSEARQRAVDARVSSMLIAAEAKKRGKSSAELIEAEINSRVAPPTEPEIKAAYDFAKRTLSVGHVVSRDVASKNIEELQIEVERLKLEIAEYKRKENLWLERWQLILLMAKRQVLELQWPHFQLPQRTGFKSNLKCVSQVSFHWIQARLILSPTLKIALT